MSINMKELRKSRGLTIEELAHRADVSHMSVYRSELPTGNPQIKTVEKILSALGLELTTKRIK